MERERTMEREGLLLGLKLKPRKLSSVTESLRLKQHCLYSPGSKGDLKGRKEASSHFCMSHSMALA